VSLRDTLKREILRANYGGVLKADGSPPVLSRLCRAGCGREFKLVFADSPDAISQQTCAECMPMLLAALGAVEPNWPYKRSASAAARQNERLSNIKAHNLLVQLRTNRVEFEAAWRLGASAEALRAILKQPVRP